MKIYILTIGTRGDVQPYIALGLGLKSVGHEVTIATLKEFDDLVTELCTVCNTLKQPHPSACRIG